ncbi:serum amyloid A-5 protein-like [Saccostrea echinata]|uniref:serum amyloid A-5 protein-like n=1 Tax=Saccostrea echinata TaxID=191078 RepID=UPI002A8243F8|nr:serum amyloid A-5 protein-like [Saccostrea echinata]
MRTITLAVVLIVIILLEHSVVEGWWGSSRENKSSSRENKGQDGGSKSVGERISSAVRSGVNRAKEAFQKAKEKVQSGIDFAKQAAQGAGDMNRAYSDMKEANWKNSDKYFHARGNYDAAKRGPGGAWAAKIISDARENYQSGLSGQGAEDTAKDQEANEWGRKGGDPNKYRPKGLPDKYR